MVMASIKEEMKPKQFQFKVTTMFGEQRLYEASSVEHLRVQVACHAGVFTPCVSLLVPTKSASVTAVLRDNDNLVELFSEPLLLPYVLLLSMSPRSIRDLAASTWFQVIESHLRFGDENALERLKIVKRDEWLKFECRLYDEVALMTHWCTTRDELAMFATRVRLLASLGISLDACGEGCWHTRDPLIHVAAKWGNSATLTRLLAVGADPDAVTKTSPKYTALYWASNNRHANVCAILLDQAANLMCVDKREATALHYAAKGHETNVTSFFNTDAHMDIEAMDIDGNTPLHGPHIHSPTVPHLLQVGADKHEVLLFQVTTEHGDKHLYQCGSIKDLRYRIARVEGVFAPCVILLPPLACGHCPLKDDDDLAQAYKGASDAYPYSLFLTLKQRKMQNLGARHVLQVLDAHLRHGDTYALLRARDFYEECWDLDRFEHMMYSELIRLTRVSTTLAERNAYEAAVMTLLGLGINLDGTNFNDGGLRKRDPLLHYAAKRGNTMTVRTLLHLGANPNAVSSSSYTSKKSPPCTALDIASEMHHEEAIAILMHAGGKRT